MAIVVRRAFKRSLRPDNLSSLSIERDHLELMFVIGPNAIRMNDLFVAIHVFDRFGSRHNLSFDCGGNKDTIAPNYRRRMSTPGDRHLPFDIADSVPTGREVFLFRDALP